MMRMHLLEKPMRERMPGTGIYSAGLYLGGAGLAAAVLTAAGLIFTSRSLDTTSATMHPVIVPVRTELPFSQAGTYTIFHEFRPPEPKPDAPTRAGLRIGIRPADGAPPLPLRPVPPVTRRMLGNRRGVSFLEVDIPAPGNYSFEAAFASDVDTRKEETALVITAQLPGKHILAVAGGVVLTILGITLGTTVLFIAAARRRRAWQRAESVP